LAAIHRPAEVIANFRELIISTVDS
jgi:hypothetical protein